MLHAFISALSDIPLIMSPGTDDPGMMREENTISPPFRKISTLEQSHQICASRSSPAGHSLDSCSPVTQLVLVNLMVCSPGSHVRAASPSLIRTDSSFSGSVLLNSV